MKLVLLDNFENFNFQLGTNSFCSDSMKYYTFLKTVCFSIYFAYCTILLYKCVMTRFTINIIYLDYIIILVKK